MKTIKIPRVSIGGLMLAVAIIAFPIALLGSVLAGRPMLGLGTLDMGVAPSVTVLGIGLARIILRPGHRGPFTMGFQLSGWGAVIAYVACCRVFPEIMVTPYLYYINDVEPYILDTDYWEVYAVSLVLSGFIWGIPQLLVALAGGGLAALVAPRTIVVGGRASPGTDSICTS
jgi:hypothetical protein